MPYTSQDNTELKTDYFYVTGKHRIDRSAQTRKAKFNSGNLLI